MSNKNNLRLQRNNTIINNLSKLQEKDLLIVVKTVIDTLNKSFKNIKIEHHSNWKLMDIVNDLNRQLPTGDFINMFSKSSMKPDGGILFIIGKDERRFPILITEKKNQGTNYLRKDEGKPKQAMGNAIERLGKNVIGFRTAMMFEKIFPFVCFGDGCDFNKDSSILDRVVTIAQFGKLNTEYLYTDENTGITRGSFFFREKEWTINEMFDISYRIAEKSTEYYLQKYGQDYFIF